MSKLDYPRILILKKNENGFYSLVENPGITLKEAGNFVKKMGPKYSLHFIPEVGKQCGRISQ